MARYRVYANYIASRVIGEVEADTEEEAIEAALDEVSCDIQLCHHCAGMFVDGLTIDEDSCSTDLIE